MLDGIGAKVSKFGETLSEWVRMDEQRGERLGKVLGAIELNTRSTRTVEVISREVAANADGATETVLTLEPERGSRWIVHLLAWQGDRTVQRAVEVYTSKGERPLVNGFTLAGTGLPVLSPNAFGTDVPFPEGVGITARFAATAPAGTYIKLHIIATEITETGKKLTRDFGEAGPPDTRTADRHSVSEVNFREGREVPVDPDKRTASPNVGQAQVTDLRKDD